MGIFEILGECLNPETANMRGELATIEAKIKQIERQGGYTSQVAQHFHLGMVGSGRNTHKLNQRRERELDKTISNAVIACELYNQQANLKYKIEYIESGQRERDKENLQTKAQKMAEMWRKLKPGDFLPLGNPNGNPIIAKMNLKSCVTDMGTKWNASEIIGNEAAKLL